MIPCKSNPSYLQEAVPHQRHQQLVPVLLPDQGGVLRGVHAGEVKHGHVRLPVVVKGKVQRWELIVGGKVSSFTGVGAQCFLADVVGSEQPLRLYEVLRSDGKMV